MTFMKHYDPKPLLVKKDGTLFIHKGHLVFVAFSYTTHYPPSAELIYLALKKNIVGSNNFSTQVIKKFHSLTQNAYFEFK